MERVIASREGIGTSGPVLTKNQVRLARVMFENCALVLVKQGTKVLRNDIVDLAIGPGEAVAIAGGESFEVINIPGDAHPYESSWIAFDTQLIATASTQSTIPIKSALPLGLAEPAFVEAFHRSRAAISDGDDLPHDIAVERLRELLVWVRIHGGHFVNPQASTLSSRVRSLLSQAPERGWNSDRVARQVAMSEATLRRHLAAEGVSLSELLAEVRMNRALSLIQSTDLPISQIAQDVGYESPSRFAVRFRKRFGYSPTFVRGHREAREPKPVLDSSR